MAAHGKILVTGCLGQLGTDLMVGLAPMHQMTGIDLPEVDIRDLKQITKVVRRSRPDIVIHAAAYTDVDGCEANHDMAFEVNRDGTWNVAHACAEIGARMLYYSTDYVFDGAKGSAYVETDTTESEDSLRPKQAGRRRGSAASGARPCHLENRLGLRSAREEFRQDHDPYGKAAGPDGARQA